MFRPLETHWKAVKHILRYLKGTLHHGLLLQPHNQMFPSLLGPIVMLIGQMMLMTVAQHLDHVFSLVQT